MPDRNARTRVSPETLQPTGSEDSGIASLALIAQLSGVSISAVRLRHLSGLSRRGLNSHLQPVDYCNF